MHEQTPMGGDDSQMNQQEQEEFNQDEQISNGAWQRQQQYIDENGRLVEPMND